MVKCYRKSVSLSDVWVSSNDKLSDFYASSWQRGESPIPLLVVRMLLTALALGILVFSLVEGASPYWLIYLTNWGLLLITMMMVSGLLVSCVAVCKANFETKELPWYVSTYWFLYNIVVTNAFMITALYWILLYEPGSYEEGGRRLLWLDISTHAMNSCIALIEVLASRTPVRFLHFYQPLSVGAWYAAFSGIYYSAGGTDSNGNQYIYEVLDWREGKRTGAVVAASVAGLLAVYVALWCLALCRDKLSISLIRTISHDLPAVPPDTRLHTRIV
ncbi:protein rolling stone-like [Galleria mellonella]|uniref:Protein rolling stone-like n=1 Tax=Galleria mellonella TaxID=7137 RepID=A0A6J1WT91_GALME|nr:protein rolling stone-like [Galleria mellonella]